MNVYPINNINFKANYYKAYKYGQSTDVEVITDNAENLGSKPVHVDWFDQKTEMVYDGKYYTTKTSVLSDEYRIFYEDTGKYELQGQERFLDKDKINSIIRSLNKTSKQVLMKGTAKGLLVHSNNVDEKLLNSDTPLIIICDNDEQCYKYFEKAEGLILKSGSSGLLSHFSAICRDYFSFGHLVSDEQSLAKLNKFEGKFISISNENGNLDYQEIAPITKSSQLVEKITVPEMRRIDKILSLDECEKDTVGNKAYNLKRMMNLVKEGKLQDVIIPSAFVLPHAYLERVENYIAENPENRFNEDNEIINEIKDYARGVLSNDNIMVRSAFNGEDLEGYSAAGLYDSFGASLEWLDLDVINRVLQSKNKPIAVKSRERHGIKDDEIKPSVIIQDRILSDYVFTTYTESPLDKNKLLIEMLITDKSYCRPEPFQITFDKNTGKLAVEKEHEIMTEYIFDENYNILKTLYKYYPNILKVRYNVSELDEDFIEVYETIGKKIGAIISGGEVDYNRVSDYILNDIKNEYIKNITFDRLK